MTPVQGSSDPTHIQIYTYTYRLSVKTSKDSTNTSKRGFGPLKRKQYYRKESLNLSFYFWVQIPEKSNVKKTTFYELSRYFMYSTRPVVLKIFRLRTTLESIKLFTCRKSSLLSQTDDSNPSSLIVVAEVMSHQTLGRAQVPRAQHFHFILHVLTEFALTLIKKFRFCLQNIVNCNLEILTLTLKFKLCLKLV